jgi:hypothetical protein
MENGEERLKRSLGYFATRGFWTKPKSGVKLLTLDKTRRFERALMDKNRLREGILIYLRVRRCSIVSTAYWTNEFDQVICTKDVFELSAKGT